MLVDLFAWVLRPRTRAPRIEALFPQRATEIYRHAENDQLRRAALDHLAALEAEEQIK